MSKLSMLSFMAVVPHGDEILHPVDEDSRRLQAAMMELKRRKEAQGLTSLIVVTPHSIRMEGCMAVVTAERLRWGRRQLRTDLPLARGVLREAQGLPVQGVNFGALEGPQSVLPLDWGSWIPLSFLHAGEKLVVVAPARGVKVEELERFGMALGRASEAHQGMVGLLVSADHAHAHTPSGPYGYSPMAEVYDRAVTSALRDDRLEELEGMDPELIEQAKPDSFWQLLIALGVLRRLREEGKVVRPRLLAYGRPSYYGMAVAAFEWSPLRGA